MPEPGRLSQSFHFHFDVGPSMASILTHLTAIVAATIKPQP
jgi:hypothetical protein